MKIVARPVDMIAVFYASDSKTPAPRRFRYSEPDGERMEINVDQVISIESRRFAGIDTIVYKCQSEIAGILRLYELKYIIGEYRWELYKI